MGTDFQTIRLEEPEEPRSSTHEVVLGLRADVHPDGDSTSVAVHFSNMPPFRVHVPLAQAGPILNELQHAAVQMVNRQQLHLDRGASQIIALCEQAARPAQLQILVEPLTHDRVFIFQFSDRAPISVRISPAELPIMLAQLARAIARSVN